MTSLCIAVKKRYQLILVVTLYFWTSIPVFAQGDSYSVMEVVEVEFNSKQQYDNPYLEVDVWVELKKSGSASEVYRIPIFWDGGNVFRARLVATSAGNWTWKIINETVQNSDQGFVGQNGSFTAIATDVSSNPNNRGFISVDPNTNRTLQYADGTPFFYTADTSWSALTAVFGFDQANDISGISFQDYILARKNQGFNGLNVIASFPDDTYLEQMGRNLDRPGKQIGLWSSETWGKKIAPNGATPFEMKGPNQSVTDAHPEVDYKRIDPEYWQAVDERMQYLSDQGFVTLFESVRRHERWPFRAQDEKNAFYNYIRYLWARYGCYNMIFSWVHHDTNSGNVYPQWRELVNHANSELYDKIGDHRMPYGQPRTAMSFNSSLKNWDRDIPSALDIQNVSNAERDEDMHIWLRDIYHSSTAKPALNLEPFYPGWGLHSQNEINADLDDTLMAQMQMYGSVLSGGLAGHAWGDAWYAGAAASTGRSQANGGTIVPTNDPQKNALSAFESQAMGHLKSFILDSGHDYRKLIPAADTNLSDSQGFIHTLSISDDKTFALGFFTGTFGSDPDPLPELTNLSPSQTYLFEWWDVTNGRWISAGDIPTTNRGQLKPPALPNNNDRSKNWAYRIRANADITPPPTSRFVLRINSGGGKATYNGNTFVADTSFDRGRTLHRPQTGLTDPYSTFRYSRSQLMGYDIPLDNGNYTVRLHFAELWFGATGGGSGGPGKRVFDVSLEGQLAEDNLDVFAEVGAETMLVKEHQVTVTDGELNIDFSSLEAVGGERHPTINAIEILGNTTENEAPVAVANANVLSGRHPLTVQFSGSSSSDDTGVSSYSWDFGDGEGSSTEMNPMYTFTAIGSHKVQLTVTDEGGLKDFASSTIVVAEPAKEDDLVGHWTLDEPNGVSAYDVSGQDHNGILERGLTFNTNKTSGQIGGALIFDGSDDQIRLPDIDKDLQSGFSVSAWVKPSNAEGGYQGVVGSSTAGGFMMFINRGKLAFKVTTNEGGKKLLSKGSIQNNVWQMISCTFDGSEMRWYINNTNVHSESLSGTLKGRNIGWIGWSGWSAEYFRGSIDDVRLFKGALTQQQVNALFEKGNAGAAVASLALKTNLRNSKTTQVSYVHPNPTKGRFRITGMATGVRKIIVTDLSGRVLITMETDDKEPELDLSDYKNGIYIVKEMQNGLERTYKVVKE